MQSTADRRRGSAQPKILAPDSSAGRRSIWKRLGFGLLNLWLIVHLTGIVAAPATVGPSSQTCRNIWLAVSPYLQCLYLNHGFHYFAPQPGSSHLIGWTVYRGDTEIASGRFPDRSMMPRLLYHRHFMLSEFLGNSPEESQSVVAKSFEKNLCRKYGGTRATLSIIRHDLPTMPRIREGGKLSDGDLYQEQPLETSLPELLP